MTRARAAIVLAALVAWAAAPVAPAAAPDEAERAYRRGYEALQAGDCAAALVHYRRSFELAPRPRTRFNMAVCEEELGLLTDAWHSYHAFLELAEARDAEIVVRARARIAALRGALRGKVTVESSPPGAAVHLDGERQARGVTPLTLSLAPGAHTIRLVSSGAAAIERTVELAPDELVTVAVSLARASSIAVVADPPDAVIAPDGAAEVVGRYEAAVEPGRHALTVRRDGFAPARVEIDAVAGRSHVEHVRLRPLAPAATLVIAGAPEATVAIDGEVARPRSSAGALELRGLSAGARAVAVTVPGAPGWRDTIHLSPGEVVTLELELPRPAPRRRAVGWGLATAGGVAIAGGGVVGVLALRDVASPHGDDHDRGKRRALLADGLIVAGAAAAVVAWRLLRARGPSATITRAHEGAP